MSKPFNAPVVMIVGEATAGEASAARKSLEALIATANKSNFDIAEQCHKIKSHGWYAPYTTFQEYSKTLGMKARKIQYLTRMAGVFEQVGVPRTTYEPLGIARCREITSLDPGAKWTNPETNEEVPVSEFIKGFVEKGETIEMDELKKHVRVIKGFVGERDLVWVNLCLQRGVYDNVYQPGIEKAKAMIGSVGKDDEGISQDASDAAAVEVVFASFNADETVGLQVNPPTEAPEEFEEEDDIEL